MSIYRRILNIKTKGECDIIDLTSDIRKIVKDSNINTGLVNIFCPGSTCAISTIEYEPGLLKDLPMILERIAPKNIEYEHHKRWGDFNGHSHVRATLIKSSLTIPIEKNDLIVGTWQQIIFIELDVRPRNRRVIVTVYGE